MNQPASKQKRRCAVYTRKSHEEGLDMEFNSIDAQRESGLAFIESQRREGWIGLDDRYDDPAYTGGNMDRPGLQRLLRDVEDGKVDCIVVYKIDRLTRSLADFAKMIEIFDAHEVSFVSVTQQFNTTTSMGRLTLNILLSFAQFEREMTSERIRDKFLASRKKGMWMGGSIPLGYNIVDKKLVINKPEAEVVGFIFKRFTQLGSTKFLVRELNKRGNTTKKRILKNGRAQGGLPFNKGSLYKILNNCTYIGKVEHKGIVYPGVHDAIIDQRLWDNVHKILEKNYKGRGNHTRLCTPALLKGILSTKDGYAMTPTHNRKEGRLYRYYVSSKAAKHSYEECSIRQIPAGEIEEIVLNQVQQILRTPEMIMKTQTALGNNVDEKQIINGLRLLDPVWAELFPTEQARIIKLLIEKVIVDVDGLDFYIRLNGLASLAAEVDDNIVSPNQDNNEISFHIHVPVSLKRRDGRKTIVVPQDGEFTPTQVQKPITGLQKLLVQAHRWQGWMDSGKHRSATTIAQKENVDPRYVQRVLRYALLAPDIIEAILYDQIPDGLAARNITNAAIPFDWTEQRVMFGLINDELQSPP